MKLDNWLAQRAHSCPERTALVTEASSVTYAELEAEATWVARRLAAYGVRRDAAWRRSPCIRAARRSCCCTR